MLKLSSQSINLLAVTLVLALSSALGGCVGDVQTRPGCTSGSTQVCACSDGRAGNQVCTADNIFGTCDCGEDDCLIDTDDDGQFDCRDEDDDNDGLTDVEEAGLGTDPRDADSDRDGLNDDVELGSDWSYIDLTDGSVLSGESDPAKPTLLIEIDSLTGFEPSLAVVNLANNAFDVAGFEVFWWIDPASEVTPTSPLEDVLEMEQLLFDSDNGLVDAAFDEYLHVYFAEYGEQGDHGKTHYADPNDPSQGDHGNWPSPVYAGSFIWTQRVIDDFESNRAAFEAIDVTQDMLISRSLVHEIGHMLGCMHEGPVNDVDYANVMILNSVLGNPSDSPLHWETQFSAGHTVFSAAALEQMDLAFKASVETGASPNVRRWDMGPEGGTAAPEYFIVSESTAYDASRAFGFVGEMPVTLAETGSNPGDERTMDFVRGDTTISANTQFRITNLGSQPLDLGFRLGATLDEEITVRCEFVHPGRTTAYRAGPISPGGDSQETSPDLTVRPTVDVNALGFDRTEVILDCLDQSGTWSDAPIEFIEITKNET